MAVGFDMLCGLIEPMKRLIIDERVLCSTFVYPL